MKARAKQKSLKRVRKPLDRVESGLAGVVRDMEKTVRGGLRRVERRAARVELLARKRVARVLREIGKQIRRAELAVAPPKPKRAKRTAGRKSARKPVRKESAQAVGPKRRAAQEAMNERPVAAAVG